MIIDFIKKNNKLWTFLLCPSIFCISAFIIIISNTVCASGMVAKSADSFVDSIGITTHLNYQDSVYFTDYEGTIKPALSDLAIRHIRDDGSPYSSVLPERAKDLYNSYGIKSSYATGYNIQNTINFLKQYGSALEMIEAPNEPDNGKGPDGNQGFFRYGGHTNWYDSVRQYQQELYAAVKSDPDLSSLPVLGPALALGSTADIKVAQLGNIEAWVDYGNSHNYAPKGYTISQDIDRWYLPKMRVIYPTKKLWATETGFACNDVSESGVSESVQAKYYLRMPFDHWIRGFERTYYYQLIDNKPDGYGLMREDKSKRQAFYAVQNLISLLSEKDACFVPQSLNYSFADGDMTNIKHTLFQKSDGRFYIAVWQDVLCWDDNTDTEIAVSDVDITLRLPLGIENAKRYVPLNSAEPVQEYDNPVNIRLSVPAHPVIMELTPSFCAAQEGDLILNPVEDTYVRDGAFKNENYGSDVELIVKNDTNSLKRKSYLKFDFGSYDKSLIGSAKLRMYVSYVNIQPQRTIRLYGVNDEDWNEDELTWVNAPEGSILIDSVTIFNLNDIWYEWDVGNYLKNNMDDKIVSFLLIDETTLGSASNVSFNSKEASENKPQLVIYAPELLISRSFKVGKSRITDFMKLKSGDILKYALAVQNQFNAEKKVAAIAALYKDNILKKISHITETVGALEFDKKIEVPLEIPKGSLDGYEVKGFVWEEFSGLVPITNYIQLNTEMGVIP